MRLRVERRLPCSPEVAFGLATNPGRMSLWSTAPVSSLELGDGNHPAGVGAMREVMLPRPVSKPLEEVVELCNPPTRLVYRVVRGGGIAKHRGEMRFEPRAAETTLVWTVDAELELPGLGLIARLFLERELRSSLDRLAEIAVGALASPLPPVRHLDETRELGSLIARADAVRREQRERADELLDAGNPRGFFTRAYQHVTDLQIRACESDVFRHPSWVLHLVPTFHRYYVESLDRSMRRADEHPEHHWRAAFAGMKRAGRRRTSGFETMARAVFYGMRAHIEEDLPRALAEVYVKHYRGRCDYARFRADYLAMAPIFWEAGERVYRELDRTSVPALTRVWYRSVGARERERAMQKHLYDIPKKRRQAFERGARLVRLVEEAAA